jgi:hypothetical protein
MSKIAVLTKTTEKAYAPINWQSVQEGVLNLVMQMLQSEALRLMEVLALPIC